MAIVVFVVHVAFVVAFVVVVVVVYAHVVLVDPRNLPSKFDKNRVRNS